MEPFTDFQELASTKRHQADLGALGLVVITDPMASRRLFSLTPMAPVGATACIREARLAVCPIGVYST
jgi:hypothetical protein